MALKQSPEDGFEDEYEAEFRRLAARRGIIVEYRRDRAAIDLGLHLSVGGAVTDTRVWFQFKGIHAQTLRALGKNEVMVPGTSNRSGHRPDGGTPPEAP